MKFYNPFEKIKELEQRNRNLSEELLKMAEKYSQDITPEMVIAKLFKRGIEWYDYSELGFADQVAYYNDIQSILKNNAFSNEYNRFIAFFLKEIARDMDIDKIKYARFGPVAVEALKEHLEKVIDPRTTDTTNEINEGI